MISPYDDGWLLDRLAEEICENERARQAQLSQPSKSPAPVRASDDDAPTTQWFRVPPPSS